MKYLCCSLLGYLIGAFNPAWLMSRKQGFDIREKGSQNAGASNVLMLLGKARGVVCAVVDIAKAWFAVLLARWMFPSFLHGFAVTATACVLGHVYPFYLNFRGGKGLACLTGIILAYDWRVFLVFLILELIIALASDYICFVPISLSVALPFVYGFLSRDSTGGMLLLIVTAVVVNKHMENLLRIQAGREVRLSYLWDPESEEERMRQVMTEEEISALRSI